MLVLFILGLCNALFVGAKSRARTGDPTIFSRVLYQLSYLGSSMKAGQRLSY